MMKSILCPIDFSESSLLALTWAADLSVQYNCHLTVLYPYRLLQTTNGDVIQLKRKNEEQAVKKFEAIEKKIFNGKAISVDFSPEVGFINDRVDYHLRKESILMIVISKGMDLYKKDHPDDFIHQLSVPVLVLP